MLLLFLLRKNTMEEWKNKRTFSRFPAEGEGGKKREFSGRSKTRPRPARMVFNIIFALVGLVILAAFIYQGISGMKGGKRLHPEDFMDTPRPDYKPDDYGLVADVYDGDTVLLEDGRKIRYLGMDTPETAKPWNPVADPYADEAEEYNYKRVMGKKVGLIYGPERKDHYGRTLAYIIVDGSCVNAELLRRGLARLFVAGRYMKFKKWILKAEAEAKNNHLGLWSQTFFN